MNVDYNYILMALHKEAQAKKITIFCHKHNLYVYI